MIKIQRVSDFSELRRLRRDLRTADHNHMRQVEEISDLKKRLNEGKKIETIEQSAEGYFYDAFDKGSFTVKSITRLS